MSEKAEKPTKAKKGKKSKKSKGKDEDEELGLNAKKPELKEGDKQGELIEEIAFDPEKFNPFDREAARKEEALEKIKPNQQRKVLKVSK